MNKQYPAFECSRSGILGNDRSHDVIPDLPDLHQLRIGLMAVLGQDITDDAADVNKFSFAFFSLQN